MKTEIDYNAVCQTVHFNTQDNGHHAAVWFGEKRYETTGGRGERGRQQRKARLIKKIMRNYEAI